METTNAEKFAMSEIEILLKQCKDPDDRPIIEEFIPEIIAICKKFGESGQSGGSAPYTAAALSSAIKKLCLFQPITPITGEESEWSEGTLGDNYYQNKRCSAVFKEKKDNKAYYLDAIIWKGEEDWDTFTGTVDGYRSSMYIKSFPFTPKKFYVDVVKEQLPEDWNEEPFIEGSDYYITEEYKKTGIKNWHKDKYRYHIKDMSQMEEVLKYYDPK